MLSVILINYRSVGCWFESAQVHHYQFMKFFSLFFVAAIFVSAVSYAQSGKSDPEFDQEKIICSTSTVCKRTCDLKITDKFETLPPDQQQLVIQCAQDMMRKINSSTAAR